MDGREAEELARARLAFVNAGQRPLAAPRRGIAEPAQEVPQSPPSPPAAGALERLAAALRLAPRHLAVIAALLALAVIFAILAATRTSATTVPVASAPVAPSASPAPSPSPEPSIRVHVVGAVAEPGVVELAAGAIVRDALSAAGGLTPDADPGLLNLAAPLSDGMQVVIGTTSEPAGELVVAQPEAGAGASAGPLNLNRATLEQLQELPGIGPVSAQAILDWRAEHGGFNTIEELQEVAGIGPKTYAKLAPLVSV